MKHQDLINRLRDELTHIVAQTEGNSAMGLTDHNKIAENLICGLMREIFSFSGLKNLNATERANYPAIDLADLDAKIAVQVTATATLQKAKNAISKFLKHDLNKSFNRLIVYVLTRKQDSYSQESIDKTASPRLSFNGKADILDFRDLLERAVHLEPGRLAAALRVVEAYNRGTPIGLAEEDFDPVHNESEKATLNLVQFFFPSTLYVADIVPDFLKRPTGFGRRKTDRDVLRLHGREQSIILPSDYCVHNGQLLTFHDLNDEGNPFAWAVDAGTVVELTPKEFYCIDEAQERVFKAILRYAFQVKLYRERVLWRHEEKRFVFMPMKDEDMHRDIVWRDLKQSERRVYEKKPNKKDPDKVFTQKHFAFAVDFYRLCEQWYVSLTPDWYFSHGPDFQASRYASGNISWLKRHENNDTLEKHFRFLVSWLKELDAEDMFSLNHGKRPNVSIGDAVSLPGLPALPDDEWLPVQAPEQDNGTGDLFKDHEERA